MISVIVLDHNGGSVTTQCLRSVVNSKFTDFELILVDNASTCRNVWLGERERIKVVLNSKNEMYAGGMNRGIEKSEGDIIVCVANDVKLHPDCLTHLNERMRDERLGAVTPMVLNWRTGKINTAIPKLGWFGLTWSVGYGEENKGQYDGEIPDYVSGACFCVRKSVIDEVGMFDERMRMWWQDVDLSLRIKKAGYKLALVSKAVAWHMGGETVREWSWWYRKYRMQVDRMWGIGKMLSGEYR